MPVRIDICFSGGATHHVGIAKLLLRLGNIVLVCDQKLFAGFGGGTFMINKQMLGRSFVITSNELELSEQFSRIGSYLE